MYKLLRWEMNDKGEWRPFVICVSESHKFIKNEYNKQIDKNRLEIIEE